jgi:tetratricopeptide (TPR) repeat protein
MSHLFEKSYSALLYDELEDYESVILELSAYLESHPNSVPALNNRGIAYWEIGKLENAQDDFEKAIKSPNGDVQPFKNWGMLLEKQGNIEDATDKYIQGVRIAPSDARINRCLAHILIKQQKYSEALPYLSQAIHSDKSFRQTYIDRAQVYEKLGRRVRAKIDRLLAII